MEKNEKKNSPINSAKYSGKEIKTVYINDIESLNDSTENNDINFNYYDFRNEKANSYGIVKGKYSNTSADSINNKNEKTNFKINSLNKLSKIKAKKDKDKENKEKENIIIHSTSTKKKEIIQINKKKNNIVASKYSDELGKNIINKLKIEKNDFIEKNENNEKKYIFTNNDEKDNNNEIAKDVNNKHKKNNYSNMNITKENEIEMEKEIEFLRKEIRIKNNIIQKLIEDNKNLIEKIKKKEIELLNSKNKEENLTKVIQENNKCISNLNELISRLIPKKEDNNEKKINKVDKTKKKLKSKIENGCYLIPRKVFTKNSGNNKVAEKKIDDYENIDRTNNNLFGSDINIKNRNNKKILIGNPVQRYFKIHHTRNNIKKHISLNQNNKYNTSKINNLGNHYQLKNNIENTNTDNNKLLEINNIDYIKSIEDDKSKRHHTISIDNKSHKNNKSYFINNAINYTNYQLMKSLTKKNMNKDNTYNIEILDDNMNEFNIDYFKGNISCKNEKIDKRINISPKKFDSNSYLSINDFLSFSNKDNNKFNLITPILSTKNIKSDNYNLDRSFNYKNITNLDHSLRENKRPLIPKLPNNKILYLHDNFITSNANDQSFSIKNNNSNKYSNILFIDNLINERNNYYSPRNKDSNFFEKQKG